MLTERELTRTVLENAFGESLVTIPAKLTDGSWPLITKDYGTPLQHKPQMPLTTLEKQWLKALLLDPRVRLFDPSEEGLEDTFEADSFAFDTFAAESIQPETLGITMLRRGVIGVSKIGFVN